MNAGYPATLDGLALTNAEITSDALTIPNKHDIFRTLNLQRRSRAISVLIFAATTGVMLLNFSGSLFQQPPGFSPEWNDKLPMADDEQSMALHQRATAALKSLRLRKSNKP